MADMYDSNKSSSSSFPTRPVLESDDISLFLQHFLHSSSSFERSKLQMPSSSQPFHPPLLSSSSSAQFNKEYLQEDQHPSCLSTGIPNSDFRLSNHNDSCPPPLDSSSNLILSSPNIYFPSEMKENPTIFSENGVAGDSDAAGAGSVKRRKLPVDNDLDDYDCESEEGFEASDGPSKTVPCRNSSKRSRAAEVHNLSEKRRRSRINEKMKALQNLIPNSNKTDKASMLDEAIEYLKQLQLQVQMLSMRNGLSLHPLYLPGMIQPLQLPQMRMGFGPEGNAVGPQHMNIGTDTQPVNQDSSTRSSFSLSNQSPTLNQSIVTPNMSNLTHPETSFGLNSSIQLHQGQFPLSSVSEEMYREDVVPSQQLHIGHATRNASECLSFDARASVVHNTNSVDACMLGGSILSQPMLPQQDAVADQNLIQHLHRKKCSTR